MSQMNIIHHDAPAPMGNLQTFRFTDTLILRGFLRDGEPWFVATDVSSALDYSEASAMTRHLDSDEKGSVKLTDRGQEQDFITINESGLYSAILKSRKPEAKTFKKWVTSEVLPSIRKTGSYTAPSAPPGNKMAQELEALEVLARFLNVATSGKITMARAYLENSAPNLLPSLPGYAVDAPPSVLVSGNGSSMVTASATELLKLHGVPMSPAKFNETLAKHGLLSRCQRTSSRGTFKHFWAVTPRGEEYGKNVVSAQNSRETQPHWFVDSFADLLADLGLPVELT